ncbi:MAG TPA: hypothetical protein VF796_10625 [Humisphaera sp.]
MGHSRLGELPLTYEWDDVVAQIAGGADAAALATAVIDAADEAFRQAARDAGVKFVFHLMTKVTLAAVADGDFAVALGDAGVRVRPQPTVFDLVGGFADAVDDHLLGTGDRTDFGEMAQMAAAESLANVVDAGSASRLFGTTGDDVREAVAELSRPSGFERLARDFVARLVQRFLTYHLSRELSAHVGPGKRFANVDAHAEFNRRLWRTCEETAVIVKDFAGGWYAKKRFETGITAADARDFVCGAFQKVRKELRVRGGTHVA